MYGQYKTLLFNLNQFMKRKLGEEMANYRVVTGPAVTTGGMCCGPDDSLSGAPFE